MCWTVTAPILQEGTLRGWFYQEVSHPQEHLVVTHRIVAVRANCNVCSRMVSHLEERSLGCRSFARWLQLFRGGD